MRERRRDCASESDEAVECEDMTGNVSGMVIETGSGLGNRQEFYDILNLKDQRSDVCCAIC